MGGGACHVLTHGFQEGLLLSNMSLLELKTFLGFEMERNTHKNRLCDSSQSLSIFQDFQVSGTEDFLGKIDYPQSQHYYSNQLFKLQKKT